jgi:small subunit ribosomal protein S16
MATKIRLQRHGRKGYAFYHVVVADSRAPRDGKFIERLGSYNPNTNPATIDLNFERALYWVNTGAQPTDTARTVLSTEGVLMMKHLLGGVKKGAFTMEEAEVKFNAWKQGKDASINATKVSLKDAARADAKARLEAEVAVNKAKAEEVAAKQAALRAEEAAANAPVVEEAPVAEEAAPTAEEAEEAAEEKVPHVAPDAE